MLSNDEISFALSWMKPTGSPGEKSFAWKAIAWNAHGGATAVRLFGPERELRQLVAMYLAAGIIPIPVEPRGVDYLFDVVRVAPMEDK